MQKILATQKGFKESMGFKRILKYSFYIPLSLITILTIFFSVWIGIKLATEITVPIVQVKEGASIIAKGKFDINLDEKGKDEIGTLVSAFNTMARELKFAKEELEAKNRYMEIILDNVATGIISADKRGNILLMNRAARHILGIDGDKVPSLKELMGTEFKAHMRSFIKEARSKIDGSVIKDIRLNLKKDVKYIRVSMTLLKDEQQRIEGFIIAFDDITYIIRAERLATWREVAKRLTHEIKNPLTPIRLSAERIRRRLPAYSPGVERELIDETTSVIIRSVDDIKGIVNELTRFTQTVQTKNIEDINAIVEETTNIYKNLYHNITFIFDLQPIPSFRLDREGIKRVLINLITNSVKAIDKTDGSIVVRTTYEEERGIGRIEVSDNGIGIPDEDKTRVFDPYFTKDPHGTGLGLTIVHSIILEHNGKIRLEDNNPKGTRVIIELPVVEG
jgi:two-component system nitrogen regulation sensor histidine kinase NtrY